MNTEEVLREFNELPANAQKEVADFIAFLHQRYALSIKSSAIPLSDEPFIGMWSDRSDMADSSEWVRTVRTREWE
jgi:hypothetical protein